MDPVASVKRARKLHALLLDEKLSAEAKNKLAREIAGVLFSAEANSAVSNRARIFFLCLRTQAHLAACGGQNIRLDDKTIESTYDDLEALISSSLKPI